ncbi:ATP-binding protein [Klebsiella variicola]|uniref:ATP-binding protein n=1 Tax=Klebsiella variicola TaxID=244366 RepID=UPI00092D742E|nr:ATP-binding protein [Klebsiella variicola]MDD9582652.1 ATP-binding protein [Klebsiella variicola]MDD9592741.1 ATP-binding protein [Klebsiella variicola]MDD9603674.1 ATP-binding protein [Klebsiella variicola]MDD9609686.1 ATP-binding protein [Klebsiella variicola]
MLNLNQLKEREDLMAQQAKLGDELAFAEVHTLPWGGGGWNSNHTSMASCPEHGGYERFTLVGKDFRGRETFKHSRCPACIRSEQASVESGLRELRVSSLLDDAGITRRFGDCEFDNYLEINQEASRNLAACKRYANNWPAVLEAGKSLVLTGSCGTGKNHLAVSLAKNIIRNHLASVELTDVMRLTRAVKSTWRRNADTTEESVLDHYASLDLLIIDEVGVQFGSPTEMTILHEIINARYESVLPTILISNLPREQLKEFISDRIFDRVTDGGRNYLVFNWTSFRGNNGGMHDTSLA